MTDPGMEYSAANVTSQAGTACPGPQSGLGGQLPDGPEPLAVTAVLAHLAQDPVRCLVMRWNWKSALLSSLFRAAIFFFVNLLAGWHAAIGAMLTELLFRSITSGFYGAVTEAFADAQPRWVATCVAMVLLPCLTHSLEFLVHWLRGTPKIGLSITVSVMFTVLSTWFNLYAMRRGVLKVGQGSKPLYEDLSRVPHLLLGFITAGPRALARYCQLQRNGR
jgi:hypothetical protein